MYIDVYIPVLKDSTFYGLKRVGSLSCIQKLLVRKVVKNAL